MPFYEDENAVLENDADDDMSGYTVYDEDELYRRKILAAALLQEEEETIASPIPENEQKVIVDNADFFGLCEGDTLTLILGDNGGQVERGGNKVGDLKAAFAAKLKQSRKDSYVKASVYTFDPPMIKLEFSAEKAEGFDKKI